MQIFDFFKKNKKIIILVLGLIFTCIISFLFATRGINRATHFHPDEYNISRWVPEFEKNGFLNFRLYPEGLYVLTKPFLKKFEKKKNRDDHLDWCDQDDNAPYRYENYADIIATGPYLFVLPIRWANVVMFVLATLSFYLLAFNFYKSTIVAVIGGLIFGCNFLLIEHTHYAESDIIGLLFALLTMCATCLYLKKESRLLLIGASVLGGFAFSAKFSNSPIFFLLLLCIFRELFCSLKGYNKKSKKTVILFVLVCIIGIIIGVCIGLPHIYNDYDSFIRNTKITSERTYAELNGILADIRHEKFARIFTNLTWLKNTMLKFGMLFWIIWLFSAILFLGKKKYIKYSTIFVIYPIFR